MILGRLLQNAQGTTAHARPTNHMNGDLGVPSKIGTQHAAPLDQTTFPQPMVMPSMP